MVRYVAYFRVSTEKQGKSGLGLAAQRSLIERFLSDGDEVVAEYVEVQSGKNDERIELWKAINHAKRNDAKLLTKEPRHYDLSSYRCLNRGYRSVRLPQASRAPVPAPIPIPTQRPTSGHHGAIYITARRRHTPSCCPVSSTRTI